MRRSLLFAALTVPVLAVAPAFAATQAPAQPAAGAAPAAAESAMPPMKMKTHHVARTHRHHARMAANSEQEQTRMLNEQQLKAK